MSYGRCIGTLLILRRELEDMSECSSRKKKKRKRICERCCFEALSSAVAAPRCLQQCILTNVRPDHDMLPLRLFLLRQPGQTSDADTANATQGAMMLYRPRVSCLTSSTLSSLRRCLSAITMAKK